MRPQGGERGIEGSDRAGDQRPLRQIAGIGDQITGREIIRAVDHEIVLRDQLERVSGGDAD